MDIRIYLPWKKSRNILTIEYIRIYKYSSHTGTNIGCLQPSTETAEKMFQLILCTLTYHISLYSVLRQTLISDIDKTNSKHDKTITEPPVQLKQ